MKYAKWFALALTFMPMLAAAQFNGRTKIVTDVPFQFRIGNKLVPAGQCTVEAALPESSALVIRNAKAGVGWVSAAMTKESREPADHFALVFHKYGEHYFLSGIKVAGLRQMYRFPESKAEAEVRAELGPSTEEVLLASQ
jgi:hypothetical protein